MAQRVRRGIVLPFHDRGTRRDEWSAARPGRTLPPGKTRYPLYRRLGVPQGRSGRAENLALPGFDPRTVQPVVSRHTDWLFCMRHGWRKWTESCHNILFQSRSIWTETLVLLQMSYGTRLWKDQTVLGGILDFETEGSWQKMTREVAVPNRLELR